MSVLKDVWGLLTETPDERRQREREGRVVTKRKPPPAPTNHPDDHYGFAGMDAWSEKKRKGKH